MTGSPGGVGCLVARLLNKHSSLAPLGPVLSVSIRYLRYLPLPNGNGNDDERNWAIMHGMQLLYDASRLYCIQDKK